MNRKISRAVVICRLSLLPVVPFLGTPEAVTKTVSELTETTILSQASRDAFYKEVREFWRDPDKKIVGLLRV